ELHVKLRVLEDIGNFECDFDINNLFDTKNFLNNFAAALLSTESVFISSFDTTMELVSFYHWTLISWDLFFQPFSRDVWCLILAVLVVFALTLKSLSKRNSLASIVWNMFYSDTSSSFHVHSPILSVVLAAWIMYTFFVNMFYNTMLFS